MLSKLLARCGRAAFAYGAWALLTLVLAAGALAWLTGIEHGDVQAARARAQAGAADVEQTAQAVIGEAEALQSLAQTLLRLADSGNRAGVQAIDQELRQAVQGSRPAVQAVAITRRGRLEWTMPDASPAPAVASGASGVAFLGAPVLGAPVFDPAAKRWSMQTVWPLEGMDGAARGELRVWLNPAVLSEKIARQVAGEGAGGMVRRLPDGAILAASDMALLGHTAESGLSGLSGLATMTPGQGGGFRRLGPGVDQLVGFHVSAVLPVVSVQTLDAAVVLARFRQLRRVALCVVPGVALGALLALWLLLANRVLRGTLGQQVMLDPLTGLYNRRYVTGVLDPRFQAARRDGLSAAVLMLDLDGFKLVNGTRGHATGDALLRQVAVRLRACSGADDHVMRLGGDGFAIVRLCRQQPRDLLSLARFVVNELGKPYEVSGTHTRISASVGVALYPSGGEGLDDLLRSADVALSFVKDDGGNAYRLFEPSMEEEARTRRVLEADLREALARGQLDVCYQPLFCLDPRRVSGFEALLRWRHPTLGLVMPAQFIGIAEESGLIAPIGAWVLRQACQEATRWPRGTRVAVNLSPVQFERSDVVDIVASTLRQTGLDPGLLELEITEGVVLRDLGNARLTMRRLQALGVRLAMDDFGTGHSSLSYLRHFPFDKVKIDASFLADLHGDGGTIIRAVLGMCGHLNLDTLVEGVETEEQLSWLHREGCTEAQGHLFSPPRPAAAVAEMMASVGGRPTLAAS